MGPARHNSPGVSRWRSRGCRDGIFPLVAGKIRGTFAHTNRQSHEVFLSSRLIRPLRRRRPAMTLVRLFSRLLVSLCLAAVVFIPQSSNATAADNSGATVAGSHMEVRLRKLHLVRPDLIPYPIAFEVCC